MKIITRTAAAAMLVSLPLALGACGGESKPSKDEVKAGMLKAFKSQPQAGAIPEGTQKKYTDCVIDKSYDKLSNKALNAIKKGDTKDNTKVPKNDEKEFKNAITACTSTLTGG